MTVDGKLPQILRSEKFDCKKDTTVALPTENMAALVDDVGQKELVFTGRVVDPLNAPKKDVKVLITTTPPSGNLPILVSLDNGTFQGKVLDARINTNYKAEI